MKTKNTVFIGSLVVTVVLLLLVLVDNVKSCSYGYGSQITLCMTIFGYIKKLAIPLVASFWLAPSLFFFSLSTYRMKDEVFRAWWPFARGWAVAIIAATLFFEYMGGNGGTLGMGRDFVVLILGILYFILIIGSLVKIVRAYAKTRK